MPATELTNDLRVTQTIHICSYPVTVSYHRELLLFYSPLPFKVGGHSLTVTICNEPFLDNIASDRTSVYSCEERLVRISSYLCDGARWTRLQTLPIPNKPGSSSRTVPAHYTFARRMCTQKLHSSSNAHSFELDPVPAPLRRHASLWTPRGFSRK